MMILIVEGPGPTIEGQALVFRMSSSAMLRDAHDSMCSSHEVRLLQLRGQRSKDELVGLEVPVGPQLGPPDPLTIFL